MDATAYLNRIRYDGPRAPTIEVLRALHRHHLEAVPFENLDIVLGRRFTLDVTEIYDKIVRRGRGGFCYELNGGFRWLLEQLGFEVALLSAQVFVDGTLNPPFDHASLKVTTTDGPYLADVGFGRSFIDPLPFRPGSYEEPEGRYRLSREGDEWKLELSLIHI